MLKMERFVTSTRVDPSGESSSKRKTPCNAWLEHCDVVENTGRNGMCERNWSTYEWVMSKTRNRLSPTNAEKLVYIFHNMRAFRTMEIFDWNFKYVADVQALLLEQDNAHGSDSEILDPSDTSDSSDSD